MTQSPPRDWADLRQRLSPRRDDIVGAWKSALAPTGYVPLSASEQRDALSALTHQILDLLLEDPFEPEQERAIGAELVKLGYTRAAALGRTLEVFGRELSPHLV